MAAHLSQIQKKIEEIAALGLDTTVFEDEAFNMEAALDRCILRLISTCCNGDKLVRATELAKLLTLEKSMKGALTLVTRLKLPILQEKFSSLLEERMLNDARNNRHVYIVTLHADEVQCRIRIGASSSSSTSIFPWLKPNMWLPFPSIAASHPWDAAAQEEAFDAPQRRRLRPRPRLRLRTMVAPRSSGIGWATGSGIVHRALDSVIGPHTIQVIYESEAPPAAADTAPAVSGDACGIHNKAFTDV